MKIAVTGASGKTGYRIVEEAIKNDMEVTLITRKNSVIPENLKKNKIIKLSLDDNESLDQSLKDMDALIIATGARATIDLTGPARVDALGVFRQLESCKRVGIKRVILVSSLCTGKLLHPLNLFGLILLWKKLGENLLKSKQFDWTIIRPGGLKEDESLENENIYYSKIDTQVKGSIPRRLVAKCCINAIKDINSINKTIEITSSKENEKITFKKAMQLI